MDVDGVASGPADARRVAEALVCASAVPLYVAVEIAARLRWVVAICSATP